MNIEWFENWFDTKYYHLLYDNRDESEAEYFMKNLIRFLKLKPGNKILDLPCGKGRHAVFLNSQGFDVVGADLSKNSIQSAKRFENKHLKFHVHDMRDQIVDKYDAIFNLFTSFGYFDENDINIAVLVNFKKALNTNGFLIIDFLNIEKLKHHLIPRNNFVKNGIHFFIERMIKQGFLIKNISFEADGNQHHYSEKIRALDYNDMIKFSKIANLKVKHVFGDYNLAKFDEKKSERLILVMQ